MKILLVDPPGKNKGLNSGLAYLSAVLEPRHEVCVLDLNNLVPGACGEPNPPLPERQLEDRVSRAVEEFRPDLFGVSVKTFTVEGCRRLLRFVKSRRPSVTTVAGGPHVTLEGVSFLQETGVDFGVSGEGELALPRLCDALEGGGRLEGIDGIISRSGGDVRPAANPCFISDLDTLPLPLYDHFSSVVENGGAIPEYPLLTSRGCPYRCSYCSMPKIMGGTWRAQSPSRVIEELRSARRKYRSGSFTVVDDNFTLDLKRVEEICDLLIAARLGMSWNSQNGIRADRMSEDLASRMKRSGCHHVWVGIESADEEVFRAIEKGEKLDAIRQGIGVLKGAGIKVGGFFIVGLPGSTRASDLKSLGFVKENGIDGWWFNFVPYPRTAAREWVLTHGKLLQPLDGAIQYGAESLEPVFETDDYSRDERIRTYDEIHASLGLFERLADPARGWWDRWRRIYRRIEPFGWPARASFLRFLAVYPTRLALRRLRAKLERKGFRVH